MVTTRNARFQQWQALLTNRTKRQRHGAFLVHGVRPITAAVEAGWEIAELLHPASRALSSWARQLTERVEADCYEVSPELLAELGEKNEGSPELLALVRMPADDLDRIPVPATAFVVVLDRPANPGNIGTIVRSADALGADGVVITGHAADVYDPKAVRASRGSLFALPVVRVPAFATVREWADRLVARGVPVGLVGTDESGDVDLIDQDLTGPTLLVVGNETTGMSQGAREGCDALVRIPMRGSASSLNAAAAATVVLYEASVQRRGGRPAGRCGEAGTNGASPDIGVTAEGPAP